MQAPARHMVPAVNLLKAPPGAPDHMSDLNQVVGDPAKSESHNLWSKRTAESPVHGGNSSSSSNSSGPVHMGTAWVLHMGPWLASMGPAHGPLAWVLHKGPGRGSCTRTPGEGLAQGLLARVQLKGFSRGPWTQLIMALTLSGLGAGLKYLIAFDLMFAAWLEIKFQDEGL